MAPPIVIRLDHVATHVDVRPGAEIIIRGSFYSDFDGARIDAATTTWPAGSPGGSSVDQGGLIDFGAGGFRLTSRDPNTHEIHAVATGDQGAACGIAGVASPCLPLRLTHQAHTRFLSVQDWKSHLKGEMVVEGVDVPVYAPAVSWASKATPYAAAAGIGVGLIVLSVAVARHVRKRGQRPAAQLAALARRVRDKAAKADPILAAPLSPALESALRAVRDKRVDPGSTEGLRVADILRTVEARLDAKEATARAEEERKAADDLVHQVEIALEAAEEASRIGRVGR